MRAKLKYTKITKDDDASYQRLPHIIIGNYIFIIENLSDYVLTTPQTQKDTTVPPKRTKEKNPVHQ